MPEHMRLKGVVLKGDSLAATPRSTVKYTATGCSKDTKHTVRTVEIAHHITQSCNLS